MRLSAVIVAVATVAVSACATDQGAPPAPAPSLPPWEPGESAPPRAENDNDCAVIAAVAKEHYQFGPDNVPPPLWLSDSRGETWNLQCDWTRYGLTFPRIYDPEGRGGQWVRFQPPNYDGNGATIRTGIMHGPLAGTGSECRVISGFAGWTVGECKGTWIS